MKNKKTIIDIIAKANKISRKSEIAMHGKSINYGNITRNKKAYTRKIKHKVNYE